MKSFLVPILCIIAAQPAYCDSPKEAMDDVRCDSGGYYFDRGGRRMFETTYDSYKKSSFNMRRGHLWKDRSCPKRRCHSACRALRCRCAESKRAAHCYNNAENTENLQHEHYSAQDGLTRWPSANGPTDGHNGWFTGTSAFPNIATPIWLRDTGGLSGEGGYATPTSWQGFQ